jgi:AcrR family transcriptional regulator
MNQEVRTRIMAEAAGLFHSKGYRNVTMDELAARLKMSKKTLYVYFNGKEQIAREVLAGTMESIAAAIARVTNRQGVDAVKLFYETIDAIKKEVTKLSPLFIEDVQIIIPDLWEAIEKFRANQMAFIENLLSKGQQEGVVRAGDTRLMAVMITESVRHMARPDMAAKYGYSLADGAEILFRMFIDGIRSKGE